LYNFQFFNQITEIKMHCNIVISLNKSVFDQICHHVVHFTDYYEDPVCEL